MVPLNPHGLPSSKRLQFAIEHGPVEIVYLPWFTHRKWWVFHGFPSSFVSLPEGIIIFPISIAIKSGCHIDIGPAFHFATFKALSIPGCTPVFFGPQKEVTATRNPRERFRVIFRSFWTWIIERIAKSCFRSFRKSHTRFFSSEKVPRWSDWDFLAGCSIFQGGELTPLGVARGIW